MAPLATGAVLACSDRPREAIAPGGGPSHAGVTDVSGNPFNQCRNGNGDTSTCDYATGAINRQNSTYSEGDAIPVKWVGNGVGAGTSTANFRFDIRKDSVNAYDFIVGYDLSVPDALSNPCVSGEMPAGCPLGAPNKYMLTTQYNAMRTGLSTDDQAKFDQALASVPAAEKFIAIWGGTITSVTFARIDAYTASMAIDFTAAGPNVVLAWGGHFARTMDWGAGKGAGFITGAPFHFSWIDGGNKDLPVQKGTILPPPSITMTKTPSTQTVSAGTGISFTISVSNAATAGPASNLVITDTLPAGSGLSWSESPDKTECSIGTGALGEKILTCSLATLAAGGSFSVTVQSSTTTASCGTLNNVAHYSATETNGSSGSVSATVQCPSLTLTKTADSTGVSAGSQIGFVLKATNAGPGTASSFVVKDTLPDSGLSWSIAPAVTGCAIALDAGISKQVLTCTRTSLAANDSLKVHVQSATDASDCKVVNNTGWALASNAAADSGKAAITVSCPDLALTKTADATTVSAGTGIGFTLTASNGGSGTASGVVVKDTLPNSGLSWSESPDKTECSIATDSGLGRQVLTCNVPSLAASGSFTVHVTSATDANDCKVINNTGWASATNAAADSGKAAVTVQCPSLSLTKTADSTSVSAGSQIGFVLKAVNGGPGTAASVVVKDTLPDSGLSWSIAPAVTGCAIALDGGIGKQVLTCTRTSLAANDSLKVHVQSVTDASDCKVVNNTGWASASNAAADSGRAAVTVKCPTLGLTKTADAATASAGEAIGFTLTVSNSGAGSASVVLVTDTLPNSGLSWSESPDKTECSIAPDESIGKQVLTCALTSLASGGSFSVHLTSATDANDCKVVNNTGWASAANASPTSGSASTTVECPNLTLTKTADATTVSAGTSIGFTLTAANAGPGTASAVVIEDTLPNSGLAWSESPDKTECAIVAASGKQVLTCNVPSLAAAAYFSVHLTSATDANDCKVVNNTGWVSASNAAAPDTGRASVTVQCPSVSLSKSADADTVNAGSGIGFTLTAGNAGPGTASGVVVKDTLPDSGLDWSIAPAVTGCAIALDAGISKQVLTCNLTSLAVNDSLRVHVQSATAVDDCRQIDNTGWASASNGSAADSGKASITVQCAAPTIQVTKTASPTSIAETGGSVTFTVDVKNTSPYTVTLDSLRDNVFGNLNGQGTCSTTSVTIDADKTYTCSFTKTLSPTGPGAHVDTARARVSGAGGTATGQDSAKVTVTDVLPAIGVTKSADKNTIAFTGGSLPASFVADRTWLTSGGGSGGSDFIGTCDDGGVNDVPQQVDLNCMSRDGASGLTVKWSWDALNAWTGSNTGDGCALIDTNNNGYADVAVCARITNSADGTEAVQVPSVGAADVYVCSDKRGDRCTKQVTQLTGSAIGTTVCTIDPHVAETDIHGAGAGYDVEATCNIDLSITVLAGKPHNLLNVCTFPSGEPNSNPFDCVVRPGAAFIQIVKNVPSSLLALGDTFGFTMSPGATDGDTKFALKGGVTSGLIAVDPGASNGTLYSLIETLPSGGWVLDSTSCALNGSGTGTSGSTGMTSIHVSSGLTTVCRFNNSGTPSDSVTYTITVTNNGLENVALDSLKDDKFGNLNGTGTCVANGTGTIKGTYDSTHAYTCSFKKLLSGAVGTSHTNTSTGCVSDNDANKDCKASNSVTVNFTSGP